MRISALGQKQTLGNVRPKADIAERRHHFRFVPIVGDRRATLETH